MISHNEELKEKKFNNCLFQNIFRWLRHEITRDMFKIIFNLIKTSFPLSGIEKKIKPFTFVCLSTEKVRVWGFALGLICIDRN